MGKLFEKLDFFDDAEPHSAALNMAIDETLLAAVERPILRVYRWAKPAVSFGYFGSWQTVRAAHPGREIVRRWTGGGVVPHGEDFTYSLLVPWSAAFQKTRAAASYRVIHEAIAGTLREHSVAAFVLGESAPKKSEACFENPVRHDILLNNRKVAGAAQRRTASALLHQGSLQVAGLWPGFGESLACALAAHVSPRNFPATRAAFMLAETKYGSESWSQKF